MRGFPYVRRSARTPLAMRGGPELRAQPSGPARRAGPATRARSTWLTLAAVLAAGCGSDAASAASQALPPPQAPPDGGPLAAELDPLVAELFALELSPGLAVAVVADGEVAYLRGFGHADLEAGRPVVPERTRFYIASASKSFLGLTAALLAHRGALDVDAPIARYLPELELTPPLSAAEITVRDLLTMTDGMAQSAPFVFRTAFSGEFTEAELIALLEQAEPAPEGRAFSYRNQPYNLLGMVIERVTGAGWKEVGAREVLGPLGLASTSAHLSRVDPGDLAMPYRVAPDGFARAPLTKGDANMHAAGGHLTTALDLARWIEAFLEDGVVDGARVFPAEVIAAATTVQAPQDRDISLFHRHGWGHGWDIGTYGLDTLVHRFGGYTGARPHVSFMPHHGIGVVALVNEAALGGRLVDMVAARIYDHLLEKPDAAATWAERIAEARRGVEEVRAAVAADLARRSARRAPMPLPLSAYAGRYESETHGTMTWRLVGEGLEAAAGLVRSPAEVYDASAHAFRVELTGGGSVVSFVVEDGEVTGLRFMGEEFAKTGG